ncbi:MAG: tryptophan--tRNA ligase [Alphaproteobacteria bacterium]
MQRIISGYQPTGQLHIGNYLGAIQKTLSYQDDPNNDCFFMIVDLHAITMPYKPEDLLHNTRLTAAAFLACGLDTDKATLFNQSQVRGHSELNWLFSCIASMGWLNRMTQFKEKAGKKREQASLGLYAYPVLQAADILVHKCQRVPVGEDQRQHLELTRDIAGTFNHTFQEDYFPLPEPDELGIKVRIMSLRDGTKKMSKSDESDFSRIHLTDSADDIALKIRKAKTDPDPLPDNMESLEDRPEARNLVDIYASFADMSSEAVCQQFAGKNFSEFKPALSDLLVDKIGHISAEISKLMKAADHLDAILKIGNEKASISADKTVKEVQQLMGFLQT